MPMMLTRWTLTDNTTNAWTATVYAERYERADPNDPTEAYNFWIGNQVVATVDRTSGVTVSDSGGRLDATP